MSRGIIDRFEGDLVILEVAGQLKTVNRTEIPDDSREGDILIYINNCWQIDREATAKLKEEIKKLADEVWE